MLDAAGIPDAVLGLAGAAAAVGLCWVVGSALVPQRPSADRMAWGLAALLLLAWTTLFQPLLGASWFSHRLIAIAAVAILAAAALYRARASLRPHVAPRPLAVFGIALAVLCIPLWWAPASAAPIADMRWHEGWIRQVAAGLPEPSGVYAGVPNSYPWLLHATAAWLSLLPGGMTELFWAMQVLSVGALCLGCWLLSRELGLGERAACLAMALAALGGGVGWLWVHEPAVVVSPGHYGRVHGDFIAGAAVVPALSQLPAILPRDLAIALYPLAVWFLIRSLRSRSTADAAAAGGMVGSLLLVGPVAAVVAAAVVLPLAAVRRPPLRAAGAAVGAAAAVVALWAVPLAVHAHRFGGFVPSHPNPSVTAGQALIGLGMTAPLGVAGLVAMRRRGAHLDLAALGLLAAVPGALCLAAGLLPGHDLAGVAPVVRLQRYLPFLALGLALPGGWAVSEATARLAGRPRAAVTTVVLAAACASTVLCAIALARSFSHAERLGLVCSPHPPIAAGQLVAVAGLPAAATAQVDDAVFRSTGAFVLWRTPPAQVRYRRILGHIATQGQRAAQIRLLAGGGRVGPVDWVLAPRRVSGTPVAACTILGSHRHAVRVTVYRPRPSA